MSAYADELYTLLKEVFLLLDDGDRQLFGEYNLTQARFYALYHLGLEPGASPSHLSARMFCDKSNITRLIKGLEHDGLVTRHPHESDRRSLRLFLTPAGKELREQVLTAHHNYNLERLGAYLHLTAQGTLSERLQQLRDGLQHQLTHSYAKTTT